MKTILAAMLAAAAAFSALAAPNVVVRMGAFSEGETPAFTQGAVVEVVVSNASERAISGEVALRVTRWDGEVSVGMRPSGPLPCFHRSQVPTGPPALDFSFPMMTWLPCTGMLSRMFRRVL